MGGFLWSKLSVGYCPTSFLWEREGGCLPTDQVKELDESHTRAGLRPEKVLKVRGYGWWPELGREGLDGLKLLPF